MELKKSNGATFEEWSFALNNYAMSLGFFENMVEETGSLAWKESFDDDMGIVEAFDEAWRE